MNSIQLLSLTRRVQRLTTFESTLRHFSKLRKDEGDWSHSPEWWDPLNGGHTVSQSTSEKGNGVVSVVAHPSSLPVSLIKILSLFFRFLDSVDCLMLSRESWGETERWLEKRYKEIMPKDDTRQSTVKVMAACREMELSSVFYMQQPHCLAVPCEYY